MSLWLEGVSRGGGSYSIWPNRDGTIDGEIQLPGVTTPEALSGAISREVRGLSEEVWLQVGWTFDIDPQRKEHYESFPICDVGAYWQKAEPGKAAEQLATAYSIHSNMTGGLFQHKAIGAFFRIHWDPYGLNPGKGYKIDRQ
jgi:hypothetical protein